MIEQMKKVSIVILNKEKESALKTLRKIGLVHLQKLEGSGEKLNAFKEYTSNAIVSESILGEIKLPKQKGKVPSLSDEKVIELCSEVVKKSERKKQLMEEIAADTTELDRFSDWGSVCVEDIEYLKEKNIQIKMYEIPVEKYNMIDPEIYAEAIVNQYSVSKEKILKTKESGAIWSDFMERLFIEEGKTWEEKNTIFSLKTIVSQAVKKCNELKLIEHRSRAFIAGCQQLERKLKHEV